MDDYSNIHYVPPNFPSLSQLSDGRWQQIWELQLSEEHAVDQNFVSIEQELSNEEIEVEIVREGKIVYVKLTTIRWQLEDDLIIYSFYMFEVLNTRIQSIESIQGQEKKRWVRSLRSK